MKKIKVMSIFGIRPEASKMAPIIKAMEKDENIESIVCVTAQHREMLDMVLNIFDVKPDYDLDIMKAGQTLADITVRCIRGLEEVMLKEKPDLVLVHGDPTTALAASLSAFYNKIKVGHVEAGLRSYDKYQPYPEEVNRKLIGSIADLHFAPTKLSKDNLLKENIDENSIFVTGNTAIDCMKNTLKENYKFKLDNLNEIDFENKRIITVTAHRRENLGEPLKDICNAILDIVNKYDDVEVVYAVHLNPAVRKVAFEILGNNEKIHLTEPLDLDDMHNLMARSYMVLTDSGGLQEEVAHLNKPVLVLRNVTERPEGIEAGTLKLAGNKREGIYKNATLILDDKEEYEKMANAKNPFGDGHAAERIVAAIKYHFGILSEKPEEF
ncbi:MAG: UDP-N-acetylglucosamine 2-epimerase (non-hydrolyzing) [Defluviitaleaceae bacterium]|nr:UDP-N-acetylglucosamine 2-epimerase (non-hydrolyzing) [Defluviitaleaceae bacterium]